MKNLLFISIILLSACSTSENEDKSESRKESTAIQEQTTPKNETIKISGIYREHDFYTCNEPHSKYVFLDKTKNFDSVYTAFFPFTNEMGANATIEALINNDTLTALKLIQLEPKNLNNCCIPYDFWCKGNEPFWQIQISEKENLIDFYDPMNQHYFSFAYSKPEYKDGTIQYKATKNKNSLVVSLKKENCSDGMSEKKYTHSVKVKLNNNEYSGCGIKYGEKID